MTRSAAVLAFGILIASCTTRDDACDGALDLYSCENPDNDHLNAQGEPDPCQKDDPIEQCPGQCVPIPPAGWDSFPMLVWMGDELAPDCPADRAGTTVFDGYMDMPEPPECPPCTCEPPTGECELPEILTANTEPLCGGGVTTDFLPDMWLGGECHVLPMPVDAMSVTIGPLTMTETGCKPSGPPPPRDGDAPGKTIVRACRGVAYPPCLDPGLLCVPTSEPPPSGFSQCIFKSGEHECPATYPAKHVAFEDLEDQRGCSECTCDAPKGSSCKTMVSLFGNGCTDVLAMSGATSMSDQCVNLDPGVVTTIEGVLATTPAYEGWRVRPIGGQLEGEAKLIGLSTFCCLMQE